MIHRQDDLKLGLLSGSDLSWQADTPRPVLLRFRRLKFTKGASLHSLRHSHCSHLLASGVPLPAVSAALGRGSIRTTQEIYPHMIHGQDDEAERKWEAVQNRTTVGEPRERCRDSFRRCRSQAPRKPLVALATNGYEVRKRPMIGTHHSASIARVEGST
jgi:hypothetical protein